MQRLTCNRVRLAALITLGIAGVFHIVALATRHWYKVGPVATGGLWRVCRHYVFPITKNETIYGFATCNTYPESIWWRIPGTLEATRGLTIMGAVLVLPIMGILLASIKSENAKSRLPLIATCLLALAGVLQTASVGTGSAWINGISYKIDATVTTTLAFEASYSWSFSLACCAAAMYFIIAVLSALSGRLPSVSGGWSPLPTA